MLVTQVMRTRQQGIVAQQFTMKTFPILGFKRGKCINTVRMVRVVVLGMTRHGVGSTPKQSRQNEHSQNVAE